MTDQLTKLMRGLVAVGASLWMATSSSLAFADGYVLFDDTIRTLSGNQLNLIVISGTQSKEVYTAKVIVENQSAGTRTIQCQLQSGNTWFDFANVTLAPGENATVPVIVSKPTTVGQVGGNLSCKVISASKTGCIAAWAKLHIEPGQ